MVSREIKYESNSLHEITTYKAGKKILEDFNVKKNDYVNLLNLENETDKCAILCFYSEKNKLSGVELYRYIPIENIYKKIEDGKSINLSGCYINEFDSKRLNKNKKIKKFRAYNSFFDGKVNFDSVIFSKGDIIFSGTTYANKNGIYFSNAIFEGNCIFSGASFGKGHVNFDYACFNGDVIFKNSIFGEGIVKFYNTTFKKGKINFSGSVNKGSIHFVNTDFGKSKANFSVAEIQGRLLIAASETNNYFDISGLNCSLLELKNIINRDIIKIKGGNLNKINFKDTINLGRIETGWEKDELKKLIERQQGTTTTHLEKADQYRMLKENFRKIGQYEDEAEAYVQFRRHKLRSSKNEYYKYLNNIMNYINKRKIYGFECNYYNWLSKFILSYIAIFANYCLYLYSKFTFRCKRLIYEDIGVYGTSPKRIAISMGCIVFLFSGFYFIYFSFLTEKTPDLWNSIKNSLYHSLITFLTIGYGSSGFEELEVSINQHFGLILASGIEGFVGLFLMSYFTVAFVKKVLR